MKNIAYKITIFLRILDILYFRNDFLTKHLVPRSPVKHTTELLQHVNRQFSSRFKILQNSKL